MVEQDLSHIVASILVTIGLLIPVVRTSKRKTTNIIFHLAFLIIYQIRLVYGYMYESSGGSGLVWGFFWLMAFASQIFILIVQWIVNTILNQQNKKEANTEIIDDINLN